MKFKIYNQNWKLILSNSKDISKLFGDKNIYDGCCFHAKKEIHVAIEDYDKQYIHKVLLHEITHAILTFCGLNDKKNDDETICDFVGIHYKEIDRIFKELSVKI